MNELLNTVLAHLRGMWHRRWIGLAAAWIAGIVGVVAALQVPERYEASARVFVDTQSMLRPMLEGLSIQPNLEQQVLLMSRTLISRPNVEKLVRIADLDLASKSGMTMDELVDSVTKRLQLSGNVTTNLYVISYRDTDPQQARKVVQSLLSIFVESTLGEKRQDTRTAVKFVDDQIKQYEENLKASEERVKEFKLKYLGVAGRDGPDYFSRLSKLKEDIENAKVELRGAEESRDAYKRELAGEVPQLLPDVPAASPTAAVSTVDQRLGVLKTELDTLRRKYTDDHPDVVGTKRIIAGLEEQRAQELQALNKAAAAAASAPRAAGADRNPVSQQLRVALVDSEANVASLRARVASLEGQYSQLRNAARLVPQVEAEFAQLNRDYGIQKRVYETLLARRQSATMGEGVQDVGATQFRVIDPPRVLPNPVPPGRIVLVAIALAAALVIGLVTSFAASEIMPTFHDARSLREVAQRPVLGMVSMLSGNAIRAAKRRYNLFFASGVGALLAAFAAVFAFVFFVGRVA